MGWLWLMGAKGMESGCGACADTLGGEKAEGDINERALKGTCRRGHKVRKVRMRGKAERGREGRRGAERGGEGQRGAERGGEDVTWEGEAERYYTV